MAIPAWRKKAQRTQPHGHAMQVCMPVIGRNRYHSLSQCNTPVRADTALRGANMDAYVAASPPVPTLLSRYVPQDPMAISEELRQAALEYHRLPRPGKIKVTPTTSLLTQRDLSLAYSPGVAAACDAIVADPREAAELTARSNLVAVITNGTAVLGLGNIGALASKPVMEGKGVLFQKFAGIDVFDIEINESDPDKLVDIIASLEPTFGGINLEDIKAPECFIVERKLRERMKIPVFHDDQHGTAIIVGAAVKNGLEIVGKSVAQARLVVVGAGAAALACTEMLIAMGLRRENVVVCDLAGVVYEG